MGDIESPAMRERLNRGDWTFIGICAAIALASVFVISKWFAAAFPEASIEFRYDRSTSRAVAERTLASERINISGTRHSAVFDSDQTAKIFLERSLGLRNATAVMQRGVHVWYWHHRWFRPLQEEELSADIAPTGELVGYSHKIPEARAIPTPGIDEARRIAEQFLAANGVTGVRPVTQSERNLPRRTQRIFTWESQTIRPAGAPYRFEVVVEGNVVGSYSQRLRVPEQWKRDYHELRSKNYAAGNVDQIFLALTMIAALVVFIIRLIRGDLPLRMLLATGGVTALLVTLSSLNSFPQALAGYDTTSSYGVFLSRFALGTLVQSAGMAILLIVIVGSGEVLYRQRMPGQLALPRLWTRRALTSKRVFRSLILGYTLVAFFLAYQVAFYLIAGRFGAWSPAEVPYDDILNTALPWVAVLFAGWFPALSEEFLDRALSIPFLERLLRSRVAAIVISGFIWGFGHATYPNQPFYIRGVEVGLAGVVLGFLFYRFGLLPLLIWHYTVDAIYTALLLFQSHNTYYIVSAAAASLIFTIPMFVTIALYLRNRGFIPDDDLSNSSMPVSSEPERARLLRPPVVFPPPRPVRRGRIIGAILAVGAAVVLLLLRGASPEDVIDYRIDGSQAKAIAAQHLTTVLHQPLAPRVIAAPLDGFRNWDPGSSREEGGGPGSFDGEAADYLVRHGMTIGQLTGVFRERVPAATWAVRFFQPMKKVETFVEIDPRTSRVIGYHKYQDERSPGPQLDQATALEIATRAFPQYGADPGRFELKEALSFQQPARRDWLFHFQERRPLAADGWRRITIRVAGREVTQFTNTVKVPDEVYREEAKSTLLNIVFVVLKIMGVVGVLALIITGVITAMRKGSLHWRRAALWTGVFAIVPLAGALSMHELDLFGYSTSIQWQTFRVDLVIDFMRKAGAQIGIFFLAVAALDAGVPYALSLPSREGRWRFGRSAIIAAASALAVLAVARQVLDRFASLFPSVASVTPVSAPKEVAIALPGLLAIGEAAFASVVVSAAIAMFALSLRALSQPGSGDPITDNSTDTRSGVSAPTRRLWLAPILTISLAFCLSVNPGVNLHATPMMLLHALVLSVVVWLVAKHVAGSNPLAYPVAIFSALVLESAGTLMSNHRPDLIANGAAELVVLTAVLFWLASPRSVHA